MSFTDEEQDAITEMVNIAMGQAAASLNSLLQASIKLSVPTVELVDSDSFSSSNYSLLTNESSCVCQDFDNNLTGTAALLFPPDSALKLVEALVGDDHIGESFDTLCSATLSEIGNIVINALMGIIANLLNKPLRFSLPYYIEGKPSNILNLNKSKENNSEISMLLIHTSFSVDKFKTKGSLLVLFRMGGLKQVLAEATDIYVRFSENSV